MQRIALAVALFLAVPSPGRADDAQCVENARAHAHEICEALKAQGLPTELSMLAVAESCGKPHAVSSKGAAGLWQLMPFIARHYGVEDRHAPSDASRGAAAYLASLYRRFQSIPWTVAAYNAGGHNLKRATGYRKGMSIEEARAFPAAYALARHVQNLIDEFGTLCE
nr:MAG TPA_asm: MltD-like protein [Caudoviricetes sp.]